MISKKNLIAKNFFKIKIKSYGDEVTDFYDKEIPKAEANHICLAIISVDSALKKDESYYPQVFLKEIISSQPSTVVICAIYTANFNPLISIFSSQRNQLIDLQSKSLG